MLRDTSERLALRLACKQGILGLKVYLTNRHVFLTMAVLC